MQERLGPVEPKPLKTQSKIKAWVAQSIGHKGGLGFVHSLHYNAETLPSICLLQYFDNSLQIIHHQCNNALTIKQITTFDKQLICQHPCLYKIYITVS